MAEEWNYRRLCETYREEKSTNSLVSLPADFHRSLQELVSGLQVKSNSGSLDASKELENARRQAWVLMRLRRQKIIMRALVDVEGSEPDGLTAQEHALYTRIKDMQKEEEGQLASMLHPITNFGAGATEIGTQAAASMSSKMDAGITRSAESVTPGNGGNGNNGDSLIRKESPLVPEAPKRKIKILKDIQAYRGADSHEYGPFASGQEAELPQVEAEWMVKGQMAQGI